MDRFLKWCSAGLLLASVGVFFTIPGWLGISCALGLAVLARVAVVTADFWDLTRLAFPQNFAYESMQTTGRTSRLNHQANERRRPRTYTYPLARPLWLSYYPDYPEFKSSFWSNTKVLAREDKPLQDAALPEEPLTQQPEPKTLRSSLSKSHP